MCKFAIMKTSRIYHELNLDIVTAESDDVCYLLLPEKMKEADMDWLEVQVQKYPVNIVAISGMKWNDMMTPWKAPALNPKEDDFKGKAKDFLASLLGDIFVNTEQSLRLTHPKRHLIGISLSGLFAVWASTMTGKFNSVASISGSFWYDGFSEWLKEQDIRCERLFLSLGDKEVKAKNERLSSVGVHTQEVVKILEDKSKEVTFLTDEGNHFDFFRERLEKAISSIFESHILEKCS